MKTVSNEDIFATIFVGLILLFSATRGSLYTAEFPKLPPLKLKDDEEGLCDHPFMQYTWAVLADMNAADAKLCRQLPPLENPRLESLHILDILLYRCYGPKYKHIFSGWSSHSGYHLWNQTRSGVSNYWKKYFQITYIGWGIKIKKNWVDLSPMDVLRFKKT